MKVLLLQPNQWHAPQKGYKIPLGLSYIASYLKHHGHKVFGIDMNYPFDAVSRRYLQEDEEILADVKNIAPDVIGMTCYTHNRFNVYFWAQVFKKYFPYIRIVLGGPHASFVARGILQKHPSVDNVILYEGEKPFLQLVDTLEKNRPLHTVPNLAYRDEKGNPHVTPVEHPIKDLDTLPFPDRTFFLHADELILEGKSVDLRDDIESEGSTVHIITSRGCPLRCKFCCTSHFWGGTVRFRSPENVIQELQEIKERWPQINKLVFHDDTFTLKKSHVQTICKQMIKEHLDYTWTAWSRLDAIDKTTLDLMKKAGCVHLKCGIESGSQKMIDDIGKKITVQEIPKKIQLIKESGIAGTYSFIIGLPTETLDESMKTIDLIKQLHFTWNDLLINFGTNIHPGTQYYDEYVEKNGPFDWENPPDTIRKDFQDDPFGNPILPRLHYPQETLNTIYRQLAFLSIDLNQLRMTDYLVDEDIYPRASILTHREFDTIIERLSFVDQYVSERKHMKPHIMIVDLKNQWKGLADEYQRIGYSALVNNTKNFIESSLEKFDVILCMDPLEEVSSEIQEHIIRTMAEKLRDDGYAILFCSNVAHLKSKLAYFLKGKYLKSSLTLHELPIKDYKKIITSSGLTLVNQIGLEFPLPFSPPFHQITREPMISLINSLTFLSDLCSKQMLVCSKKK